jgi:hypothetical protein
MYSSLRHKMEVSDQLHASAALLSGKAPSVSAVQETGWGKAGLKAVVTRRGGFRNIQVHSATV